MASKHSIRTDEDTLLALKDHITFDPNQILFKNWSAGSSICDWIGVACGLRHMRVISLDISNMGLNGTIVPQLGNLSFLVSLNLGGNNFSGHIPQELAHLRRLKLLDFSFNELTGEIPSRVIGSLNQLEYLYLNNNSLSGSIPSSISNLTFLKEMICYQNELSGSIPFEIFNISSLEKLSLSFNHLSGNLPTFMCHNLQKLKMITVWSNKLLSGPLPSDMSRCSQLRYIDMSVNNFSGTLPKDLGSMKMLEVAYFGYNSLEGTIPKEIGNLTNLRSILLAYNNISGAIPKEIGNLTMLSNVDLRGLNLRGIIPEELGNLQNLEALGLGSNGLSGSVPVGIFNISTLRMLDLSTNHVSGNLPATRGIGLPNLEWFSISHNKIIGTIPLFISNCSKLRIFTLTENHFSGTIPHFLGNLRSIERLDFSDNEFTRDSSSFELDFLRPLANCKYLTKLAISYNPLNGVLPKSIGNLSKSIESIYAGGSGISGEIPTSIGNLSNLLILSLQDNLLTGLLPTSIGLLENLQAITLWNNRLNGALPCNLFSLKRLSELYLQENMFSGAIPECIGNGTSLRNVWLSANRFSGAIPMNLWNLKDLLQLNLSSNSLTNSLPIQIQNLKVIMLLDLSMNNLSGDIPNVFASLQNLVYLYLYQNHFKGSIPDSIGRILSLVNLDLSKNNLSSSIPTTLETLQYLYFFDVSFNHLVGLIPSGGSFRNFTWVSFMFNKALCGEKRFHVPPCPPIITSLKKPWIKGTKHIFILTFSLVASIGAITLLAIYILFRNKNKINKFEECIAVVSAKDRISYYELQHATDGFDGKNVIGKGSFGSVYKGTLRDGTVVAIKVFNLEAKGAFKSFDVECEMLRNLRHRNLTKVISSCSNLDFKAIVLEFMPNGSLENWLHSRNRVLSLVERLNIMIDVASAIEYLHSGYPTPVVHADLKPSNILLDEDKVAHVSDFGIAKMLEEKSITFTKTLATFGYIAPEYGTEGLVSTKCDVYSFGIMLMEVFTRKTTHDEMFNEGLNLHGWVNNSMRSAVVDIIDDRLLKTSEETNIATMMDCVTMTMNVALRCTKEFPRERCDIKEVIVALNKIKLQLLSVS